MTTGTRTRTREALLDAAYARTVAEGWHAMRMADVAADAGLSRQTLYNEFGTKPALGEALVLRETERFLDAITRHLHDAPSPVEAVAAAVGYTLREGAEDTLLKAVLTSAQGGDDSLLPFLTRSEPVLHASSDVLVEFLVAEWPEFERSDVELVVDALVRLTVSHLVLPIDPPEVTAARLARLVEGFLSRSAG